MIKQGNKTRKNRKTRKQGKTIRGNATKRYHKKRNVSNKKINKYQLF